MIQKDEINLDLNIIKNKSFSYEKFDVLLSEIKEYCNPMSINVKFVNKIETEQSGKMRIIKGLSD